MATLDEFAGADRTSPGFEGYLDTLPEDVQRQLIESSAGHAAALRWLHDEGYDRATYNMVNRWRNEQKRRARK